MEDSQGDMITDMIVVQAMFLILVVKSVEVIIIVLLIVGFVWILSISLLRLLLHLILSLFHLMLTLSLQISLLLISLLFHLIRPLRGTQTLLQPIISPMIWLISNSINLTKAQTKSLLVMVRLFLFNTLVRDYSLLLSILFLSIIFFMYLTFLLTSCLFINSPRIIIVLLHLILTPLWFRTSIRTRFCIKDLIFTDSTILLIHPLP